MSLHRFYLEDNLEAIKTSMKREKYFFARTGDSDLIAWITRLENNSHTVLKLFIESSAGVMTLQDVVSTDLPIKIHGIRSDGGLLTSTGKGYLYYYCDKGRIMRRAELKSVEMSPQAASISDPYVDFPGMKRTDQFLCETIAFNRYESMADAFNGKPFFKESFLMACSAVESRELDATRRSILIGNSQIDNLLNLVSRVDCSIFQIPLDNFVVNNWCSAPKTLLVGWNKKIIQSVSLTAKHNMLAPCSSQVIETEEIGNSLLEDISTCYVDSGKRMATWKDLLSPGQFCIWNDS